MDNSSAQWRVEEPLQVGPVTLPRRVFLPAHQPGLAENGVAGDRYIAYHRARARAGAAMQITGANPVVSSTQWSGICLWNVDESCVPGYQRLGEAVRAEGGRMLVQLAHPGPTEYSGPTVLGPSRDLSEPTRQVVVAATRSQLLEAVDRFAAAADRCRRGELDGVEISMAHGLLLGSFLSPLFNRRDDEYGGDFERRLTLCVQVLDAVRANLAPDQILGMRLGADDLVPGGLTPADAAEIARALEPRVDYISVMVGNNNRLEARVRHWPPTPAQPGLFRHVARTVRAAVTKPVAAVGRIGTLELANDLIVAGDADLVGMVRAQIADADLIAKTRAGRVSDVRPCIGANVCVNELLRDHSLTCMINPDAGGVGTLDQTERLHGHKTVVIGAGPAGLEAARRLAERGSTVVVFESESVIGGQVQRWSAAPSRRELRSWLAWAERQLVYLGGQIRRSTTATAADVAALAPDTVIVAAGSRQVPTAIDDTDGTIPVLTPDDVLDRPVASARVVVFDEMGELDCAFVAEHLQESGHQVTLVTARLHLGEGEGINTLFTMLRNIAERGITVHERLRPLRIADGVVTFEGVFGEPDVHLRADLLVGWSGGEPRVQLADELRELGLDPIVIGDALRPRRVTDATMEAKQATDSVGPASVGPARNVVRV